MKVQDIWRLYGSKKPVIDIGCGWNILFEFEYVRFDIAAKLLGTSTSANHFGDFHDMSAFPDETFAFANANQVIEHAEFPEVALKEWIRILQVGGVLHLCWPHVDTWDRQRIEKARDAVKRRDMQLYYSLGGIDDWISVDSEGNPMLDLHWNKLSLEDMKAILPKNVSILEEHPGITLILRKIPYAE